jgi:hypothetical protein
MCIFMISTAQKYQLTRDQITFALPTADVRDGNSWFPRANHVCTHMSAHKQLSSFAEKITKR